MRLSTSHSHEADDASPISVMLLLIKPYAVLIRRLTQFCFSSAASSIIYRASSLQSFMTNYSAVVTVVHSICWPYVSASRIMQGIEGITTCTLQEYPVKTKEASHMAKVDTKYLVKEGR